MRIKYQRVIEGIAQRGEYKLLNDIYTDLYITESGKTGDETEMKIVEASKNQETSETPIKCNDMFKRLTEQDKPIRTMLTQGIAGIGKSFSVQKFILEWAKGSRNQDIKFIFPLPFRELNLKEGKHSLMEILNQFFPQTKGLRFREKYKVMFVFDGLDECRLPLKFKTNESCFDVTHQASLDVLLTNLIKGNLLPSALIWITTRPAAAAKIPAEFIDCVTELRGFNDEQKIEYFRKRISNENLANNIIDHITGSRVLYVMCHIPVFCWISSTVLERLMEVKKSDTPKTLTQMYIRFLIFQTMQQNYKYDDHDEHALDIPWDKKGFLALGKLAFEHLKKNNFLFYSHDLSSCDIDINDMSVYSGVCTQETGMFLGTTYSFMHLSIQEFIAALYAYVSADNDKKNVFLDQNEAQRNENEAMIGLLKTAINKAMESENGHLDLFLRFLLGLSLESNQHFIRGLLTQEKGSSHSQQEIVDYIKAKFEEDSSPDRTVNLFHCLNELNDRSLVNEMQNQIKEGKLSMTELSRTQWSALLYVLLTSDEDLDNFDLRKFVSSEECLRRLLPVVETATTAWLNECNLTEGSCMDLVKILSSVSSKMIELDMSSNTLQDSGVKQLSEGLKSPNCKLEILRLNNCGLTEEICSVIATVISLESCTLKELELSENNLQNSGVEQLMVGLANPHVQLKILRLCKCSIKEEGCSAVASALAANPSHLKELDLTGNNVGVLGVKVLSTILNNSCCKLETLKLSDCSITGEGYFALASALKSNSCLTELDLRGNDPGDKGVKLLTDLVEDQSSTFKTLRLLKSPDAEEAHVSLTKLLNTNPLLLIELDLSAKIQSQSVVKKLPALLEDSHCRLQILRLNNNNISEKDCCALVSALCSNPSYLRELDLSLNTLGLSGMERLNSFLENPHCILQKLGLKNCSITEEGYSAMVSSLEKHTPQLRELDLGGNKIEDSGLKQLSALLKNSSCNLTKLKLCNCHITEEGYKALASALESNPSSHLTELHLRGNYPGKSGVKLLKGLLADPNHKLKKLMLLNPDAEESCSFLAQVLDTDPLLLTEMNLSEKIQGNSDVRKLCTFLQDSHCGLQKLKLVVLFVFTK
uniref:NACHT domain-containing protein n=1 Tax=Electrophorus electricus TaxID=8005 RepID=A0A4W4E077_ELEEL